MRRLLASLVTAAAVTLAGCNLDLTNPNNPTLSGAKENPRVGSGRMIDGVLATYRVNRTDQVRALGSFGRETYYMFITDGRFITGPYRDWRSNNSFDAGTQWAGRYGNYRNAYEALKFVATIPTDTVPGQPLTLLAEEKAGARGVLKTLIALEMLHAIEARGPIGAVVDMVDDQTIPLPIVSEDSVYKWISAKLDEAQTDLVADTMSAFYFPVYAGFASGVTPGPGTPAGFRLLNRAIKARAETQHASLGCGATCYATALTALTGTWIADLTATNRDNGVYAIYSTAAGDFANNAAFTGSLGGDLFVHPEIDSIAGVALDDRYRRKISSCPSSKARSESGVSAGHRPCTYASTATSIPIIRNEELVLLRAEAEWFTGNTAAATTDLAAVRANSGASNGGTSVARFPAPAVDSEFVSELLLQRALSLYQEAHRWVDYRRFSRLKELGRLPQDTLARFTVATMIPLPNQECDSRNRAGNPGGIPLSCPGNPVP
jgi:hypothetical protein